MRIRLPLGRTVFFVCAFLFAAAALLPLRLALDWLGLDQKGISARETEGSMWLGSIREARLGPIPLGDLHARLRSLPLLLGRARVDLVRDGDQGRLEGSVTSSRHAFALDDIDGALDVGSAFAPIPVTALSLSDVTARFEDGLCVQADGAVKATVAGTMAGIGAPASLSGSARCDRQSLLIALSSASAGEAIEIRIDGRGRYQAELLLRGADPAIHSGLIAAGFVPAPGGYVVRTAGQF